MPPGAGRADAGRVARIDRIEIERDAETAARAAHERHRFAQRLAHAALGDLVHEENAHAEALEELGFAALEAPHAEKAHAFRIELRAVGDCGELRIAVAQQARDRHAVQHAAFGRLRRVRVHVRVDPEQPHPRACTACATPFQVPIAQV